MNKLTAAQKDILKSLQFKRLNFSRYNAIATSLVANGLIFRSWYEYDYSEYAITRAGLAYLYQDAPMVDQPQPTPRRCTIDIVAAHQMVADAQALNAKLAAEAAVIRNSK